jgi:tetratricopeptide (TPR) repeat protein
LDSSYAEIWYGKGLIFNKLGKYGEALEFFEKALELDPDNAETWYEKGLSLKKLKQYQEALKSFNKALKIDPEYKLALKGKKEVLDLKSK